MYGTQKTAVNIATPAAIGFGMQLILTLFFHTEIAKKKYVTRFSHTDHN
jgi:hypothetical protein